ncbi:MAG: phosphate/phosphite/phosphonate ABC transporter substrate-binding protein [Gammaproteobacteria bacterium]|nr:phosphate/phosphite/phosphonate ABC transporter substrate-binding protein [Gammaproteobacteria bacterium]MDH5803309.1 phosphate/phosphite/phosphonate ABC transporter substrate-binding protein [Gammaproteobacteria bacterium]
MHYCLLVSLVLIVSCTPSEDIKVLRVGVLPDQSSEKIEKKYGPLFEYLAGSVNAKYEIVIPSSYDELLIEFHKGNIDIAYFGAVTFIMANIKDQAVPLAMRDVDMRFTSIFIAPTKYSENKIKEFKGKKLSFGSKLSTSGHLMPRYFLANQNISPETYFSEVLYSGAHDKTALMVQDGVADIGVANANVIRQMFADGDLDKSKVKEIWETPPYPDYVWAASNKVPKHLLRKLIDAFTKLDVDNETHKHILQSSGARNYYPASMTDFKSLVGIMKSLGFI